MLVMILIEFFGGVVLVDGYGFGFFCVGGKVYYGVVIVIEIGMVFWVGIDDYVVFLVLVGKVDVLFLGMGVDVVFLSCVLVQVLEVVDIMVELMNMFLVVCSYNVMLFEGRCVVCVFLLI